jgi:hypothetical protein
MEVNGNFHDPAALFRGKSPQYPLDSRLGGLQNRSGCDKEDKNMRSLPVVQSIPQKLKSVSHTKMGNLQVR